MNAEVPLADKVAQGLLWVGSSSSVKPIFQENPSRPGTLGMAKTVDQGERRTLENRQDGVSEAFDEAQDERINPMVGLFEAAVGVMHVTDMETESV